MKIIQIEMHECESCGFKFRTAARCSDHEQDCKRRIDAAFKSLSGRRVALARDGTAWLLGEDEEWEGATAVLKVGRGKKRAVTVTKE